MSDTNILKLDKLYVNKDSFTVLKIHQWDWNLKDKTPEYCIDFYFTDSRVPSEYMSGSFEYKSEEERDTMVETLKQYL